MPEEELLEQNEPEEPDAPVADESPSAKDELAKEEEDLPYIRTKLL